MRESIMNNPNLSPITKFEYTDYIKQPQYLDSIEINSLNNPIRKRLFT